MKNLLMTSMLLASQSSFAASICEVRGVNNDDYFVAECDGHEGVKLSKSPVRIATLKILLDQGYKIITGGDVVILQK
ncbi:MAG: hypothetical protein ACXVB9_05300 [Bdellovibrionota bacterium]